MNPSTKSWLLAVLDREEVRQREIAVRCGLDVTTTLTLLVARVNDARRLVEQGPEEPRP